MTDPARIMPAGGKSAPKQRAATAGEGEGEGEGETVTLTPRDYEALVEAAEERQTLRDYAQTRDESAFSAEVVDAVLGRRNPDRPCSQYPGQLGTRQPRDREG